jgi:hypothetical protein
LVIFQSMYNDCFHLLIKNQAPFKIGWLDFMVSWFIWSDLKEISCVERLRCKLGSDHRRR